MTEITDANFKKEVLQASLPVLVDFWAPWCGPCRMLAPILEEVAQETEGDLSVKSLNIDENPMIPSEYGIRSIPSLILFHQGKAMGMQVGLQNKQNLMEWVRGILKKLPQA